MAYAFDSLKVLVSATLLAACTDANPLFHVDTDAITGSGSSGTGSASSTSGAPTSDTPTSAGPMSDGSSGGMASSGVADTGDVTGTLTTGPVTTDPATSDISTSSGGMSTQGSSSSSGDVAVCGDGILDPGEQCDEGDGINGNGQSLCTADCQGNLCGDEYVAPGEECDAGPGNGQGGECTEKCKITSCGDGYKGGAEACDLGPENGTDTGNEICSHDCTTVVTKKLSICVSAPSGGKLWDGMTAGIAGADGICKTSCGADYKAMVVGDGRTASKTKYAGDGQAAWVLQKYTAYYRKGGPLVFVTGPEALLGVIKGEDAPLINSIGLVAGPVWTGLKFDWTKSTNVCSNWSTSSPANFGNVGDAAASTLGKYISFAEKSCSTLAPIYCVQQ